MPQGFGDNSWIAFGVESTYGTPVTRTTFFEFMNESVKLDQGREAHSSLRGRSRNRRGQKKHSVAGAVETQMQVNGMELLLKHAIGSDTITGTNPYTHTFALTRALPVGLSVEVNRDASNIASNSSFLYDGCQISKMTLKHAVGDFLMATWDLIGEGDASNVAVTSPTFATFLGFDWPDFTCTVNSVLTPIRSLDELTLDNNLAEDRYNLGANKRKGLGGNGNRSISGKITLEFSQLAELTLFRSQTNCAIAFVWSNGANSLTITLPNVEFTEGDPVTANAGPILITLGFDAYISSVEGDELSAVLVNTTATVP